MANKKLGKVVALGTLIGAGAWVYKKYDTVKSMYHKVAIFNGKRYEFDEFEGEAIAAMFSGVMIDLSDAEFTEEEVYLDIYALCSGIRILIPLDVEVVLEGSDNVSGVQVDQDEEVEKTKTLYVNYNITASGLLVTDNIDMYCCDDECCAEEECCPEECCAEEVDEDIANEKKELGEATSFFEEAPVEDVSDLVEDLTEEIEEAEGLENSDAEIPVGTEADASELFEDMEGSKKNIKDDFFE